MNKKIEPKYDPITCITATELRAFGVPVPADIPGCAWVPRDSIRYETGKFEASEDGDTIFGNVNVHFDEKFRWVSIDISVGDGGARV